jgi:hypothetical protein
VKLSSGALHDRGGVEDDHVVWCHRDLDSIQVPGRRSGDDTTLGVEQLPVGGRDEDFLGRTPPQLFTRQVLGAVELSLHLSAVPHEKHGHPLNLVRADALRQSIQGQALSGSGDLERDHHANNGHRGEPTEPRPPVNA